MTEYKIDPVSRIRVVVFSSGPVLERGVKQFLLRLAKHPEIELVGVFVQSKNRSYSFVIKDLWRRRGLLAIPLLGLQFLKRAAEFLADPGAERTMGRVLAGLSNRIQHVPDIHAVEVLEQLRALKPDLGLIYGSPILKPVLFEIPALGTLGIHHGKMPEYRGKKTTFWAAYNGEETAGVTIQRINAGLDTGSIVKQGEVPIGNRSLNAIWNELERLGLDLYLQAILEVKQGTAGYKSIPGIRGKVYRDPKLVHILRFWRQRFTSRFKKTIPLRPDRPY
jgi:folate-dependent phosphoribosylglycinamide formyltransferase PurN